MNLEYMNFLFNVLNMMIMVLISIAFLTLMERKILGYIHIRKGPNKLGLMGFFQPFSDAMKLFNKENLKIFKSNFFFFIISPLFSMMLMLMLWMEVPLINKMNFNNLLLMLILSIMSLGVYPLMLMGWSSNSIYSLLGGLRGVAQTISYEVSMILIMFFMMVLMESMNLYDYNMKYNFFEIFLFSIPVLYMFYVSLLAELNRTPFDFSEGESELVSGFNVEYMSGSFALIFIAEYGMIMFMMMLLMMFFFYMSMNNLIFYIFYMFMLFLVIWIRGTFLRFRYDNLMYMIWKSYLVVILNYLFLIFSMKMLNY